MRINGRSRKKDDVRGRTTGASVFLLLPCSTPLTGASAWKMHDISDWIMPCLVQKVVQKYEKKLIYANKFANVIFFLYFCVRISLIRYKDEKVSLYFDISRMLERVWFV